MTWIEACEHPLLQNIPFKVELNRWGQIVMSPVKIYHSALQAKIVQLLAQYRADGIELTECAIATDDGTKAADVVWMSDERYDSVKDRAECHVAPEICIEIKSSSNSWEELMFKKELYLARGAEEFWLCDERGQMCFFDATGERQSSVLVPKFPSVVALR